MKIGFHCKTWILLCLREKSKKNIVVKYCNVWKVKCCEEPKDEGFVPPVFEDLPLVLVDVGVFDFLFRLSIANPFALIAKKVVWKAACFSLSRD